MSIMRRRQVRFARSKSFHDIRNEFCAPHWATHPELSQVYKTQLITDGVVADQLQGEHREHVGNLPPAFRLGPAQVPLAEEVAIAHIRNDSA